MSSSSREQRLNRRTFLRGTGVTMTLPWLESVRVWGAATPTGEAAATAYPQRFAALFVGNGINGDDWWAKGSGAQMELSKTLEPLAPFRSRLNVIQGLFNRPAVGVGIHPGQTGNILSGMPLMKGAVLRGGISMDQVLANQIGQDTVQPSLVLGCEQPITGYHESNFSMAYSSHISWQSADSPVPMEVYPSLAFDALFENRGDQRTRSILDRVRDDLSSLSRSVSADDNRRLDEYLTSVREVEKRVDRMRGDTAKAADRARDKGRPMVTMKRPDNGLPEDIREHMRLMCDIVALAFQTDKTRVATLVLCRDLSGLFYPSSTSEMRITRPRTTTYPSPTSASAATTSATSPIWRAASRRCRKGTERCSITPASCICPTCGRASDTTTPGSRCSRSEALEVHSKAGGFSTIPRRATTTANCAHCTCRCSTRWGSDSRALATPTHRFRAFDPSATPEIRCGGSSPLF